MIVPVRSAVAIILFFFAGKNNSHSLTGVTQLNDTVFSPLNSVEIKASS
jgi:hypothetical protein